MTKKPLILASSSPRRKNLLNQIGINFKVVPSNVDENFNLSFPPNAFTEHWAREKAKKIAKKYPGHIVLGADTVVVLDNKILGKPKDTNQSFEMLSSLSAKTHEVITGISIIYKKGKVDLTFSQKTYVTIKAINSDDIVRYINTYNPYDKAGSYGIQDGFSAYIDKINGCYFNVMGLPLATFKEYYDNIKMNEFQNDTNK